MVQHRNPSIVEDSRRIFNTMIDDHLTDQISPVIQPTIEIKPFANIVRNTSRGSTGTSTIFLTPTDKDFYLTSVGMSGQFDVVADNTAIEIRAAINGVTRTLIDIRKLTLTPVTVQQFVSYNMPIKIDKGSTIILTSTFTVGAGSFSGFITGYTVETTIGD